MATAAAQIIDAHVHLLQPTRFHYHWLAAGSWLDRDFGLTDVREEMNALGVVGGLLMEATNTPEEIPWLLEISDMVEGQWGVIGWIHLEQPDAAEQIAHFAQHPHFKGVRLNWLQSRPQSQSLDTAMAAVSAAHRVVDVLAHSDYLPEIAFFMRAHPQVSFVLEHLGGVAITAAGLDDWRSRMELFAALPNVALKISGYTTTTETTADLPLRTYVETAVDQFGCQRLLFGSNYPMCLKTTSYTETLAYLQAATARLSTSERNALFFETAPHIYQL